MDVSPFVRRGQLVAFSLILLAVPARAGLIINEIMNNPAAVPDVAGEWFELFNAGSSAVDLFGWMFRDLRRDVHTVDAHVQVPRSGHVVLARNGDGAVNGGLVADYVYGSDIKLGNGADALIVFDAGGIEVDRVAWDGGTLFPDPVGASMALIEIGLDNASGVNWRTSRMPGSYGLGDLATPGAPNFVRSAPLPEPAVSLLLAWISRVAVRAPRAVCPAGVGARQAGV